MNYDIRKSLFGYEQNCKVTVTNKSDGVCIEVLEADYPNLINYNLICHLVNQVRPEYKNKCYSIKDLNDAAKKGGWLHEKVIETEEYLEDLKELKKLASRKNVFTFDKTGEKNDE